MNNKKLARREKQGQQLQAFIQAQTFSGPLPPPEILTKYNEAIPNGAERIMAMAERQAAHRQNIELRVVKANTRNQYLGSILGFILCSLAIGGGIYLISTGRNAEGLTSIISALVALVAAFFRGRAGQEKERREKRI